MLIDFDQLINREMVRSINPKKRTVLSYLTVNCCAQLQSIGRRLTVGEDVIKSSYQKVKKGNRF